VLLADDDPADQELVRRAFDAGEIPVDLHVVSDGEAALDYLRGGRAASGAATTRRPDLVLLDLNMPGIDGFGVLAEVRRDERLRSLPIVVLSTSTNVDDVNLAYSLGGNAFIRKPADYDDLVEVVGLLAPYWFRLVQLPGS
jgi:CheY-like chemotaxis protein